MRLRIALGLLSLLSLLLTPPLAVAAPVTDNTFETTLANGMRVVVREDHRAPTAVQMVWYRVGSIDEHDGVTGVAHVTEHMMFKGTPRVGPGEFNRRVASVGGRDNAFTSTDYTAYFQQVPASQLKAVMVLEADRMRHLTLEPTGYSKEIQVIMEERRMRTDDQSSARVHEAMNAVAWQAHPYRRPVIGWMSDLEQMTVADVRDWYRRWYVPNNATLVVVGDVNHQQVFGWAKQTYGAIPARALPARKQYEEPVQTGQRQLEVKAPADLPLLVMGWKAPRLNDPRKDMDPYALEMLAQILDGHDAARLPTALVREQQVAVSIDTSYDSTNRGPSMFMVQASPRPGHTVEQLEQSIRGALAEVANKGVTDQELARARSQLRASEVYKKDSVMGQAMEIGMLETLGYGWQSSPLMLEKLNQVTAADVQRVAQSYFKDDQLTIARLVPQPLDAAALAARAKRAEAVQAGGRH
ncbi:M16 family metallopeptidase [Fluviibacter phosphoraccumulans]|uniref:Zinc protease n=1 Tax=Fluviibacter phosphoraccumulans TaxID=1751046 RepID=A0A679I272_9RHOO|nr:pitrilysin family protein [Fluviibacter phosphoraccumulans]BBU68520.1 zinc protease [Fluviibacter phosphoraccumulans]BBU72325.1 zinc protease [Fluviibacter phosphoraccumulans]BCA64433.1 zinc protease [Fluviibacter phosphoraccumulans]